MDDHVYRYYWPFNKIGFLLNYHFIKFNKTTNELCEISKFQRMIKFTLLTIANITIVGLTLYNYVTDGIDDKVEVVTSISIPFWVINAIFTLFYTINEQETIIWIIESLELIKNVLLVYYSRDELKNKLKRYLKLLNICNFVMVSLIIIGGYYFVVSHKLKFYAAFLCMLHFIWSNVTYCVTSYYLLANEMDAFEKIIKKFLDENVKLWYCYKCNKLFIKNKNPNCLMHHIRFTTMLLLKISKCR